MKRREHKELEALFQLGDIIGSGRSLLEQFQAIAECVAFLLPSDRISILGFNMEEGKVEHLVRAGAGRDQIVTSVTFSELQQGLSGWVIRSCVPALSPKGERDPRESDEVAKRRTDTQCGSILVVPLLERGEPIGTITAINRPDQRDFDNGDLNLLVFIASYCRVVLEKTKMFNDLKEARDATEVANQALRAQNDLKDKLITILAHDLRGPVGMQATLFEFLIGEVSKPKEISQLLKSGRQSAVQTYDLLENLLSWVRGKLDEIQVLRTRINVSNILSAVCGWLEATAESKNIRIRIDCAPELSVVADEKSLETIIRNLLSNAIKYSPNRSSIRLRAWSQGDQISIEIADQGRGLSPEKLAQIFGHQPVESLPGTNGERGSGLGLMFCAELAQNQGGYLEAENGPEKGSVFRVVLPDAVDETL